MKKLCDLVDIHENNMACVILKVKEGTEIDLISLGCFNGNEDMIRLTKGNNHTCTIFYKPIGENPGNSFSWEWGTSGSTLVSNQLMECRHLIEDCIKGDFSIYMGKDKEKIKETLSIKSLEDAWGHEHEIKVMYWPNDSERTATKNGEFYKNFQTEKEMERHFEELGYDFNLQDDYIAETGCVVEKYIAVKKVYVKDVAVERDDAEILYQACRNFPDFEEAFGESFIDAVNYDLSYEDLGNALYETIQKHKDNPAAFGAINDVVGAVTGLSLDLLINRLGFNLEHYVSSEKEKDLLKSIFPATKTLGKMIDEAKEVSDKQTDINKGLSKDLLFK